MTESNRKEQHKANALASKTKPLAKLGVPIFTGTLGVVLDAPEGPQPQFMVGQRERGSREGLLRTLHGPFDTETCTVPLTPKLKRMKPHVLR